MYAQTEFKLLSKLLSNSQKGMKIASKTGAPNGIRIRVAGLKGRCPRPLDDGGASSKYNKHVSNLQCGVPVVPFAID